MDHLHQESRYYIGTTGEFTPGFQIEGHGKAGSEYDSEVSHMSEECRKAAVVFGMKITLTDASVGPSAVETLNQLKDMAMGVDQVKAVMDKGLDVSFRHEGLAVWINVRVPETLDEIKALPGWDKIDLSQTVFSGKHDFKMTSGADPTLFLTATIDEIIARCSNFSVEGGLNFEELHHVITSVTGFLKLLLPDNKKVNTILTAVNLITAFRSMSLDFRYDPSVVRTVIKGAMESSGKLDFVQGQLSGNQGMANEFLPQAQMMAPMFIGPYSDLLKSVNLGHFEFFVMVPRLRWYIRPGFTLFGLNSFVQENFLNQ
jgi:hypothetical protein